MSNNCKNQFMRKNKFQTITSGKKIMLVNIRTRENSTPSYRDIQSQRNIVERNQLTFIHSGNAYFDIRAFHNLEVRKKTKYIFMHINIV